MLKLKPDQLPGLKKAFDTAVGHVLSELGAEEHLGKGLNWRGFFMERPFNGVRELSPIDHNWAGGVSNIASQHYYGIYSAEKIHRTAMSNAQLGYVSARMTANESEQKYGGAIVLDVGIKALGGAIVSTLFGGSGLPQDADEAVMLIGQIHAGWEVSPASVEKVFDASPENDLIQACYRKYRRS